MIKNQMAATVSFKMAKTTIWLLVVLMSNAIVLVIKTELLMKIFL